MTGRPPVGAIRAVLAGTVLGLALALAGCGTLAARAPGCRAGSRLALVAQSVPDASYVPCVSALAQGWTTTGFDAARGHTRFSVASNQPAGHPVKVALTSTCDITAATPTTPRADGARTYIRLRSITPRYAGTLFDVFPGGCVTYTFDFERGPHIALMEQFESSVGLYSRRQLRVELHRTLGVELNP